MTYAEKIKKHQLWLEGKDGGERAHFAGTIPYKIKDVDLTEASFYRCYIERMSNCILDKANFLDTKFCYGIIENSSFCGAQFSSTIFDWVEIKDCNFREAYIFRSYFEATDIFNSSFSNTRLTQNIFTEGRISGTNIHEAIIENSFFSYMDMPKVIQVGPIDGKYVTHWLEKDDKGDKST